MPPDPDTEDSTPVPTKGPKLVLVTGSSRGLGLAICTRLLADGYAVAGISRSLSPGYQALLDAYPAASFTQYDLADTAGIQTLVSGILKQRGRPWGLVNNAGVGPEGLLATMHQRQLDQIMAVNLMAPINLCKYVSRPMMAAKAGRIVNISSIITATGFNGLAAYAASKAGLVGLSRSLARELGRANITVNCVAPGYMETEMSGTLDVHKLAQVRRRAPLGVATVEDGAGAVAYLLGPDAARVTGTVLTVDGGSTA